MVTMAGTGTVRDVSSVLSRVSRVFICGQPMSTAADPAADLCPTIRV
jgi:hypothetical protein